MKTLRKIITNIMDDFMKYYDGMHYNYHGLKYKIENGNIYYDNNSAYDIPEPDWDIVDFTKCDDEDLMDEFATLCSAIDLKEGINNG